MSLWLLYILRKLTGSLEVQSVFVFQEFLDLNSISGMWQALEAHSAGCRRNCCDKAVGSRALGDTNSSSSQFAIFNQLTAESVNCQPQHRGRGSRAGLSLCCQCQITTGQVYLSSPFAAGCPDKPSQCHALPCSTTPIWAFTGVRASSVSD